MVQVQVLVILVKFQSYRCMIDPVGYTCQRVLFCAPIWLL